MYLPKQFKQANAITTARYDYSLVEKRLIYLSLMEIMKYVGEEVSDDFFTSEFILYIPEDQLKAIDVNDNYFRDYRKAIIGLRKKDFSIDTSDGWIETGFINGGKYTRSKGLEVRISSYIIPYLYELTKRFTVLDATVVMTLSSKFSQRFYEWCAQWRSVGRFSFTPDKLREMLMLKMATGDLKSKVLEVAQADLRKCFDDGISDMYFTYEEIRGGRGRGGAVQKWVFSIISKSDMPQQENQQRASGQEIAYVYKFLEEMYGTGSSVTKQAMEVLQTHEDFKAFADRIRSLVDSGKLSKTDNKAGYIRAILQNEFGLDGKKTNEHEQLPVITTQRSQPPTAIGNLIKKQLLK